MIYGYSRCSTNESKQDLNRQNRELKKAGAELIFQEFEHGDTEHKKELERLFSTVSAEDTIITTEVSRLARSTKQLCEIIDTIQEKRLKLEILGSISIDCRNGELDCMTKAFLQMAGIFSELELNMIRSRVKSGMANAKAKGVAIGRPKTTLDSIPESFFKYYPMYQSKQINGVEFCKLSGIGKTSLYKYLKLIADMREETEKPYFIHRTPVAPYRTKEDLKNE